MKHLHEADYEECYDCFAIIPHRARTKHSSNSVLCDNCKKGAYKVKTKKPATNVIKLRSSINDYRKVAR